MRQFFLLVFSMLHVFSACRPKEKEPDYIDLAKDIISIVQSISEKKPSHDSLPRLNYNEIIKLLQDPGTDTTDKAWYAIRALGESNDPNMPDTLYKIYLSASKVKGQDYTEIIVKSLIEIDTQKSAEIIAKIFEKNPKDPFYPLDDLGELEYTEKLFPSVFKTLKSNVIDASRVFELFESTLKNEKITKEQGISCLPLIEDFYKYLKSGVADSAMLFADPLSFYKDCSPDIATCLVYFQGNKTADAMLIDFLQNDVIDYHNQWKILKIFEEIKEKIIPNGFFDQMRENLDFRLEVYEYLRRKNKLELLPNEYLTQEFLSACFSIPGPDPRRGLYYEIFTYNRERPDAAKYVGTTSLSKGNYYFYQVYHSYGNYGNSKGGQLTVTGPQPFDKTKFNLYPDVEGEEIPDGYNLDEDQIKEIIKNYREK